MASKNQQELLKFLGSKYSIRDFDFEPCVYRKINNNYDIEISGTNKKNHPIDIYVWDISQSEQGGAHIVEKHFNISDWSILKALLDDIVRKYQDLA